MEKPAVNRSIKGRRLVHSRTLGPECLVHNNRWRSSYQHAMNTCRGNYLPAKFIPQVNKIVCNCDGGRMDEDFWNIYEKELKCSKVNIKAVKKYYSGHTLFGPMKELEDFLKDVLSGPFTEDHTSKYRFLLVIQNAGFDDYTMFGRYTYGVKRTIFFSGNEGVIEELTKNRAEKITKVLSEEIALKSDLSNATDIHIERVKRTAKNKSVKLVKAVLHSLDEKHSNDYFQRLTDFFRKNYPSITFAGKDPIQNGELKGKETKKFMGISLYYILGILVLCIALCIRFFVGSQ